MATFTVYDFDRGRHRVGTLSAAGTCAWGGGCRLPAGFSIHAEEAHGDSWWACCDDHVMGILERHGPRVVWRASKPRSQHER